jgi:hypothetical protein
MDCGEKNERPLSEKTTHQMYTCVTANLEMEVCVKSKRGIIDRIIIIKQKKKDRTKEIE